jgi:hypothetical protein
MRERYLPLAALLLMLSLAVKPQIGLLVVLYLLLKKTHRRYVLLALAGAVVFLLLGSTILKLRPSSSEWLSDLRANIATSQMPGHINDPTASSSGEVNLQAVTSIISSNAKISDAISYGVFAILLVAWGIGALRMNSDSVAQIVLLGALLVLSLLSVYHRYYDAALLVLTIPAILIIFEKSVRWGTIIAVVTALGSTLVQGRLNSWLQVHAPALRLDILSHKILFILIFRQQNLELLLLACLYLFVIFKVLPHPDATRHDLRPRST